MIKAIVFDFDGVIVDSEKLHFDAFNRVGDTFGKTFTWDTYLEQYIGFDDRDAFRVMMGRSPGGSSDENTAELASLCEMKAKAFEEICEEGVVAVPGVLSLIDEAAATMPIAIASGATRADIDLMLDKLGLADRFELIVSADDVARSKPDPESYARAVAGLKTAHPDLDLTASQCLSIEDTQAGINSARDAGLSVIGLTSTSDASALSRAHRVVDTLEGVTLDVIQEWFGD